METFINVNALDRIYNAPPLHGAAYEGRQEVVEWLMQRGADVNGRAFYRLGMMGEAATPLHCAAYRGHANIIQILAANNAEIDVSERSWHATPLAHEGKWLPSYVAELGRFRREERVQAVTGNEDEEPLMTQIVDIRHALPLPTRTGPFRQSDVVGLHD